MGQLTRRKILEVEFDRIVHTDSDQGTGHLFIKSHIGIGGAVSQLAFDLMSFQIHTNMLRRAFPDGRGEVVRRMYNV